MSEQDDVREQAKGTGGPAFPIIRDQLPGFGGHSGMSLRTYVATAAMQGIISADPQIDLEPPIVAGCALEYADALLEKLSAPSGASEVNAEVAEALKACVAALDIHLGDSEIPEDDRPGVLAMRKARVALARVSPNGT